MLLKISIAGEDHIRKASEVQEALKKRRKSW
jgi:hypothetical protein